MLNEGTLSSIIEGMKNNADFLSLVEDCLESFEKYHEAVYKQEMYNLVHSGNVRNGELHRDTLEELDRTRTVCHNAVIANIGILNRLAEMNGLSPVFDGIVSEERPYRRILADEVFEFVEKIIKGRE